jgi:hypothetical protein
MSVLPLADSFASVFCQMRELYADGAGLIFKGEVCPEPSGS